MASYRKHYIFIKVRGRGALYHPSLTTLEAFLNKICSNSQLIPLVTFCGCFHYTDNCYTDNQLKGSGCTFM